MIFIFLIIIFFSNLFSSEFSFIDFNFIYNTPKVKLKKDYNINLMWINKNKTEKYICPDENLELIFNAVKKME